MISGRVVVVGAGFAGLTVARRLERRLAGTGTEVQLICPADYMLYLPLLPHVASGVLPARSAVVALLRRLRRTALVPGRVVGVDLNRRRVVVRGITGTTEVLDYDHLVLAPGSVTRTMDLPGLREHGRGMKTLAEAVYLRDHVLAQLELAAASTDPEERERRCRFVVVGGGYAGVETVASMELMTRGVLGRFPRLDPSLVRWHLVQHANRLLPGLGQRLGDDAAKVLRSRGIRVELGVGVASAGAGYVQLDDGRRLPVETLVWTAGVTPNPLMDRLGAATVGGRLLVRPDLSVPGHPEVSALGDAAAVPDLGSGDGALCPPTAQHAQRQATVAADNVAASLRGAPTRSYRHRDLGLVVDLGARDAVATPFGVSVSGMPAQVLARGYHLWALRAPDAVRRVATNWALHRLGGDSSVRLGFLTGSSGRLAEFEHTDDYLSSEQAHACCRDRAG